ASVPLAKRCPTRRSSRYSRRSASWMPASIPSVHSLTIKILSRNLHDRSHRHIWLASWKQEGCFAMRRKSFATMQCPIARGLEWVGEWWSILILRDAFHGLTRFDQFQKSLDIAPNML